jgi:AcrR family transcriptional regulator
MMTMPRSTRNHEAILEAAEVVFLRDGYLGTNMDDVAAASGVSKQTVYAHFGSKHDLFVELIGAMVAVPADRMLEGSQDPADRAELAGFLQTYAERQLAEVLTPRLLGLRRLVIGEAGRFPELARTLHQSGPAQATTAVAALLVRLAGRGLIEATEPKTAASQLNWLILAEPINDAMLLGDRAIPDAAQRRRHAAAAVRVFLAAYATDGGHG